MRHTQSLFSSYLSGIKDADHGNSYKTILALFFPELITAFLLMINIVDMKFVAELHSTGLYNALGVTYTLLHTITKIAEGLSVGAVIMCGHYNGAHDKKNVGNSLSAALWISCIIGALIAWLLFVGAHSIFVWYNLPARLITIAAAYLKVRCLSIFCMFVSYGIVGFLRGVKNTRVPMNLFLVGAGLFVLLDYLLIFGKFGLPELGVMGSAWAAVVQYVVISFVGLVYIVMSKYHKLYDVQIINVQIIKLMGKILLVSLPVMVDKAALAIAKIWLCSLINPLGKIAMGTFNVIKDMEQFAFAPAVAFAQVITLLVSNDYGSKNWQGIKSTIKKILFLSSLMVFVILLAFSLAPHLVISHFDTKKIFTDFAATAFPIISVLVFFDILQIILAAALRGASNVRVVMFVRLCSLLFFFMPISYALSLLPLENTLIKFILIYSTFYIGNGLMGIIYLMRFRSERWKSISWR
ncbi:MAG: MATE family efflux transporter [Candidatus Babeliaceae bacterium]|nr:MATE family efflux transporter [Candidatus Babeliaceae bacterium]